jgi:hypothetical protein
MITAIITAIETTSGGASVSPVTSVNGKVGDVIVEFADISGMVPSTKLPSYVDDVLEFESSGSMPIPGETGKIYLVTGNNSDKDSSYRWVPGSSSYLKINTRPQDLLFSSAMPDATMSSPIGGAPAQTASVWETKTLNEIIDNMLFPTVLPTYTPPTLQIGFSPALPSVFEVGQAFNVTTFATGIKNDAGNFTSQFLLTRSLGGTTSDSLNANFVQNSTTNIADQFGYSNPNIPNISYTATWTQSITSFGFGNHSWSIMVPSGYASGLAKRDSKGNIDTRTPALRTTSAPQSAAASYTITAISRQAIYPYFWGVSSTSISGSEVASAILSLANPASSPNRVLAIGDGTLNVTFAATGQFLWFAVASNYTTKTKWYVDVSNNGNIGGGSNLFKSPVLTNVTAPILSSIGEISSRWTNIPYNIYISNYPTTTQGVMELRE